jgi:hypothetical protein
VAGTVYSGFAEAREEKEIMTEPSAWFKEWLATLSPEEQAEQLRIRECRRAGKIANPSEYDFLFKREEWLKDHRLLPERKPE